MTCIKPFSAKKAHDYAFWHMKTDYDNEETTVFQAIDKACHSGLCFVELYFQVSEDMKNKLEKLGYFVEITTEGLFGKTNIDWILYDV